MITSGGAAAAAYKGPAAAEIGETAGARAAIVVVYRKPGTRETLHRELSKRYGADYQIVVCESLPPHQPARPGNTPPASTPRPGMSRRPGQRACASRARINRHQVSRREMKQIMMCISAGTTSRGAHGVLDGRSAGPLDNPNIRWFWLKGRGSDGTR